MRRQKAGGYGEAKDVNQRRSVVPFALVKSAKPCKRTWGKEQRHRQTAS
jgi:hypothetical protein